MFALFRTVYGIGTNLPRQQTISLADRLFDLHFGFLETLALDNL